MVFLKPSPDSTSPPTQVTNDNNPRYIIAFYSLLLCSDSRAHICPSIFNTLIFAQPCETRKGKNPSSWETGIEIFKI